MLVISQTLDLTDFLLSGAPPNPITRPIEQYEANVRLHQACLDFCIPFPFPPEPTRSQESDCLSVCLCVCLRVGLCVGLQVGLSDLSRDNPDQLEKNSRLLTP